MTTLAEIYHRRGYGFITTGDLAELIAISRLQSCLIRCGSCRMTAAAQDVKHIIDIIEADGRDYVRDVSILINPPPAKPTPRRYYRDDAGPTGHGDLCHSDADPGL
jgi:hypothetical protein